MQFEEIMKRLEEMGTAQTRKTFARHGAPVDSMFGVKVADLKTLLKPLKGDQEMAMKLYDTGNSDAMYLAALLADGSKMTEMDLQKWAENATWYMISEFSVPWVTAENEKGLEIGLKWIDNPVEHIAASGWVTLSCIVATHSDEILDRDLLKKLIARIVANIHKSPNRVRHTMNQFIISVGGYVRDLSYDAKNAAKAIGPVYVDMGDTSCKVPDAIPYIDKMIARGPVKKKKTAKC
jgi:3-methyladenine DNA glycosylase AlkD